MKELESLTEIATQKPFIKRMWFYGSRYKGNFTNESDFDIAVEVEYVSNMGMPICEDNFSLYLAFESEFKEEMQNAVPYELDIQPYMGEGDTPNLHQYLKECSQLFYKRT